MHSRDQSKQLVADEIIHPNPNSSMHGSLGEDEEYVLIEEEEEEELDGDINVPPERRVVEMSTTPVQAFDPNDMRESNKNIQSPANDS